MAVINKIESVEDKDGVQSISASSIRIQDEAVLLALVLGMRHQNLYKWIDSAVEVFYW